MKKLFISLVFFILSSSVFAQYYYRDSNRIGITVGVNQLSLNTENFTTNPEMGWNAGLSMRGNYYNNWDMVYSLQFSENNFTVPTRKLGILAQDVNYKLASAQVSLQMSYRLIENHLTFEFGPIVQVNGKLKLDADKENNIINGTTLLAKNIVDVSNFNFYPSVGFTAGVKHFRFNVSYQYGLNNFLGNLNKNNLGVDFKGNPGILNGNIIIYL
ncbi:PorT family protein [Flavobacterium sp. K5-23]|uniref:PorT family protein n=1 Tax=Flavobacterium sp. K5-23 TaxID=2746225 RepID=UPI00200DDA59|nr:PorT family protein [Flavobacterium sp. K5-23]UQD55588.1 PorT family protein [Flavobacterium sp. K5-23]